MSFLGRNVLPWVVVLWLFGGTFAAVTRGADDEFEKTQAELDARVQELIKKLGDDQFATRERAQSELERMGLIAFDALYDAQNSDDIEVAMRARHLVRSLRVNWSRDDDHPEVKRILQSYGSQNQVERGSRMYRLSNLPDGQGLPALCRLVRFEASNLLSKRAALLVIGIEPPEQPDTRRQLIDVISQTAGLSKRPAVDWLRAFSQSLGNDEAALPQWEQLVAAEYDLYSHFPEQSSREIVRDLIRWQVVTLRRLERPEQALDAMRRTIDLVSDTRDDVIEAVDWLIAQEAWPLVGEVADRFASQFEQSPVLLYRLAESQVRQGHSDAAEKTAQLALAASPNEAESHLEAAYSLQGRGLFPWSENEYRTVMKIGPVGSLHDLRARNWLSEMLHDQQQELAAAEVLQGTVAAMEKDRSIVDTLTRIGREPGSVASRMHYFYSRHFASENNHAKQIEHLDEGIKADPTDADVLIAMYRATPPGDEWRKQALHHIDTATGFFRDQIRDLSRQLSESPSEPLREWAVYQLASSHNQFAWLVGNTIGDYDEAIRSSHKSLELRPDAAGYLDTLGRCYFAKGDIENAIKYQRRAVDLDPHSLQIKRQLALFEQELEAAKKNEATKDSSPDFGTPDSD